MCGRMGCPWPCPQVFEIPFNSANKWSLAVTSCPGDKSHQLVMMKGAPEIILTKCSHFLHNKQEKEIDGTFRTDMQAAYERCGFMGERVIGFAYKRVRLTATHTHTPQHAACAPACGGQKQFYVATVVVCVLDVLTPSG